MDYFGLEIRAEDGVYEPSEDSTLAWEMIQEYISALKRKKIDVLDMGTATGVLGLLCATKPNVKSVVFADINPKAIELAKENMERNRLLIKAECEFYSTDLFSGIPEKGKFDLMVFNAPYLRSEREGEEDEHNPWAGGKEGVELTIRFLEGAISHMKDGGRIIVVSSSLSNLGRLEREISRLKLRKIAEKKRHYFFEDIVVAMLAV